ncbi:hypothetical protein GCK32_013367 [Trichostrongylus colubriformis]|uniref:Uncharacterized protein n=1 Tax=Trichostrongylus colubriformis TaxID=6319 RepID=A0AAN8F3A0_TRICO
MNNTLSDVEYKTTETDFYTKYYKNLVYKDAKKHFKINYEEDFDRREDNYHRKSVSDASKKNSRTHGD